MELNFVNKGHEFGYQKFSKPQIVSLIKLCKKLKKNIRLKTKFSWVTQISAPLRKQDPGEKFPWKKLSKFNIGIWYKKKCQKQLY